MLRGVLSEAFEVLQDLSEVEEDHPEPQVQWVDGRRLFLLSWTVADWLK